MHLLIQFPNKKSEIYEYITTTPKREWKNFNIIGVWKKKLGIEKMSFDIDANAACLILFGNVKNINNTLYLYNGQWIRGGAIIEGELLNGLLQTIMDHIIFL